LTRWAVFSAVADYFMILLECCLCVSCAPSYPGTNHQDTKTPRIYSTALRYALGVVAVSLRKIVVKWLWFLKPTL
jgi:hypothetical protein